MYNLYGDGIHDDYPAIQEMLDSEISCVALPAPLKCYCISNTLKIHSTQELLLPRYAAIKLMDNSNCCMLENASPKTSDKNIKVTGGIWDMNHNKQWPNPYHFPNPITGEKYSDTVKNICYDINERPFINAYTGHCFRFNSIKNFIFSDITIVNPVVYGVQLAFIEDFTIQNIVFEYNEGSPKLWNLDGVHLEGGCKNGFITNLKGTCHDDLLAITSDDSKNGDIDNIVVNGIYAYNCHSAVRLLSVKHKVRNIHIQNIFGTYYVYLICLSKYYKTAESRGNFENIYIDKVNASFSKGTVDVPGNWGALINIDDDVDIDNLVISDFVRKETVCTQPTISLSSGAVISRLILSRIKQINLASDLASDIIPLIHNSGHILKLSLEHIELSENNILFSDAEGIIDEKYEFDV